MPWKLRLEPNATQPVTHFPCFPLILYTFIPSHFPIFPCSYAVYFYVDRMHSSTLGFHDSKIHDLQIVDELGNSLKMNGGPWERLHQGESYLPPSPGSISSSSHPLLFVFLFSFFWHRRDAALSVSQGSSIHAQGWVFGAWCFPQYLMRHFF